VSIVALLLALTILPTVLADLGVGISGAHRSVVHAVDASDCLCLFPRMAGLGKSGTGKWPHHVALTGFGDLDGVDSGLGRCIRFVCQPLGNSGVGISGIRRAHSDLDLDILSLHGIFPWITRPSPNLCRRL